MTLTEAITVAEATLERPLMADEVVMIGRLVDAGRDAVALLKMLETFDRPSDIPEDEVQTVRFEPAGDQARRI